MGCVVCGFSDEARQWQGGHLKTISWGVVDDTVA